MIDQKPPITVSPPDLGDVEPAEATPRNGSVPWLPDQAKDSMGEAAPRGARPGRLAWLRSARGLWLGLLLIPVSYVFTLLLASSEPTRTWAWAGLLMSAGLAVVAWGRTPWHRSFAKAHAWQPFERVNYETAIRFLGIAASMVAVWQADSVFESRPYEQFGLAGWLWLASMTLLVIAVAGWPQGADLPSWPFTRPAKPGLTVTSAAPDLHAGDYHAVSIASAAVGPVPVRSRARRLVARRRTSDVAKQAPWTKWEIAVFLGVVAIAVVARVWDLTDIPYTIHPDEIITGRVATQGFLYGGDAPLFQTLWPSIDLPALWFLIVAQFLKLGDSTLAAVRLPAALFGAAAVVPFYLLLRSVWGKATAITGSLVMAFGVASVHFARVTVNNIVTPFFWTACFFFLLRGLRRGRPIDWALAGILGGLSEHFYYGTRLLWLVLIVFAVYLLVVHWREARRLIPSFGLVIVGYMAAFGPLFTWFTMNPSLYFGRGASQLPIHLDHFPTSLADVASMASTIWNTLWPMFAINLLTFSTTPSTDSLYFSTLLRPIEAALAVLGLGLLIWRWRQPAAFLLLASGFGVLLIGGTLVPDPGNTNHWTPAFPAIYAAVAVPISGFAWASGRFLARKYQYVAAIVLALGLVGLGLLNLSYFFTQYHTFRPEFDIPAAKARFQAQLGTGYQVRSVGRTWQGYDSDTTSYLIKGMDGGQVWNPASELPLPYTAGKGQAFTFFPDQFQYLNPVELTYPGGIHGQIYSQSGTLLYDYYQVPPDTVKMSYGATVQLYYQGDATPERAEPVALVGLMPASVKYPVRARWTALLFVPQLAPISLRVDGTTAIILLDGQSYTTRQAIPEQPGWHQVTVDATLRRPADIKLMMSIGGGAPAEVARNDLWAVTPGSGLLGSVASPDPSSMPLVRNEQYIGFSGLTNWQADGPQSGVGAAFRASWAGELHVSVPGNYQLEIRSNGNSQLMLDGSRALGTCAGTDPASAVAAFDLTSGWHPIKLDFASTGGADTLEFYWTTPDGVRSLVPPTALRFVSDTASGPTQPPKIPLAFNCLGQ